MKFPNDIEIVENIIHSARPAHQADEPAELEKIVKKIKKKQSEDTKFYEDIVMPQNRMTLLPAQQETGYVLPP